MAADLTMKIGDILTLGDGIEAILLSQGMHCTHCPVARSESLADACHAHGVDADELLAEINEHLANKA